jgi:hypothetical protein
LLTRDNLVAARTNLQRLATPRSPPIQAHRTLDAERYNDSQGGPLCGEVLSEPVGRGAPIERIVTTLMAAEG